MREDPELDNLFACLITQSQKVVRRSGCQRPATGNKLVVLGLSSLDPGDKSIQFHSHTILIQTSTTLPRGRPSIGWNVLLKKNLDKISFQARVMGVWTWIKEIRPKCSNLEEIIWWLPSLHGNSLDPKASILRQIWQLPSLNGHNSDPRVPIDLDSFCMVRALPGLGDGHLGEIVAKVHF